MVALAFCNRFLNNTLPSERAGDRRTRARTHKTVNPEVLGSRESGTNARAIFYVRRALRPLPALSDLPDAVTTLFIPINTV